MPSYRDRVGQDLGRWIDAGLVPEASRAPILATIPDARRLDAATALAWVGAVLAGLAVIAFISANWDAIPRLGRFAIILGVFASAAGAAAWASERGRPNLANGFLTFGAIAFAGAIGLTGQIFDIAGDPRSALYASSVVAAALALAGRGSGALIFALLAIGLADGPGPWDHPGLVPWLAFAAPAAAALAVRWRSTSLAHVSAIGVVYAALWIGAKVDHHAIVLLAATAVLVGLAAAGRWLAAKREVGLGSVFYGWFVWGAFAAFIAAGYAHDGHALDLVHRIVWLAAAGGAVALGRHDRHALVTAAGVVGLLGSISAILVDLGVNLLTSAAVFFIAALVAAAAGLALRRAAR